MIDQTRKLRAYYLRFCSVNVDAVLDYLGHNRNVNNFIWQVGFGEFLPDLQKLSGFLYRYLRRSSMFLSYLVRTARFSGAVRAFFDQLIHRFAPFAGIQQLPQLT